MADPADRLNELGVDSLTSYAWIHHANLNGFPETPYSKALKDNEAAWNHYAKFRQPYFPSVSMGWDSTPRTEQGKPWENIGYPYTPVVSDNTPEAFEGALKAAKEFLKAHSKSKNIITINAWNEWTEGSYLEPDTIDGIGYLEAIKKGVPAGTIIGLQLHRESARFHLNPYDKIYGQGAFPQDQDHPLRRTRQHASARVQALQPARDRRGRQIHEGHDAVLDRLLAFVPRRRLRSVRSGHDRPAVGKGEGPGLHREDAHGRGV